MPVLPSGRRFGMSSKHILDPGMRWFPCPDGHFWYETPDLAINPPPYEKGQLVMCEFVHAPCPTTVEEVARFVTIIEFHGEESIMLTGMTFDQAVRPDGWSEEDWAAWEAWKEDPSVRPFLEKTLEICRAQAAANSRRRAAASADDPSVPEEVRVRQRAARMQAIAAVRKLRRLEAALRDPAQSGSREVLGMLLEHAHAVHREMSSLLEDPMHASMLEAWYALGVVTRLLDMPEESERAFAEACRLRPSHTGSWLELARTRGERGNHAGAEAAARGAVEADPSRSEPWANLAMALAQQKRFEECREPLTRALEINPEDRVAVYLSRSLDAR